MKPKNHSPTFAVNWEFWETSSEIWKARQGKLLRFNIWIHRKGIYSKARDSILLRLQSEVDELNALIQSGTIQSRISARAQQFSDELRVLSYESSELRTRLAKLNQNEASLRHKDSLHREECAALEKVRDKCKQRLERLKSQRPAAEDQLPNLATLGPSEDSSVPIRESRLSGERRQRYEAQITKLESILTSRRSAINHARKTRNEFNEMCVSWSGYVFSF